MDLDSWGTSVSNSVGAGILFWLAHWLSSMSTKLLLTTFALAELLVPYAAQTVFGAATTTAKVGDVVRVGMEVMQADAGLTEFTVAVPYTPGSLQYSGLEGVGLTATNVVLSDTQGSVNIKWTGSLAVGQTAHIGYVKFLVKKADKSEFQGVGVNPTAKDSANLALSEIEVLSSEAIVQLSPRPLRVQMDLRVN